MSNISNGSDISLLLHLPPFSLPVICSTKAANDLAKPYAVRTCESGLVGFGFAPSIADVQADPTAVQLDVFQAFVPDEMHVLPGGLWHAVLKSVVESLTKEQTQQCNQNLAGYKDMCTSTELRLPGANYFDLPGLLMCSEHKAMMQVRY